MQTKDSLQKLRDLLKIGQPDLDLTVKPITEKASALLKRYLGRNDATLPKDGETDR